jgi:hypothetical protein
MFAYSAIKNIENFIAEYSVWYPVTSSDSASGRSNGRRFVSAKAEMRYPRATESEHDVPRVHLGLLVHDPVRSVTFPDSSKTGISDIPIEIS